jgi:hypothetical protein
VRAGDGPEIDALTGPLAVARVGSASAATTVPATRYLRMAVLSTSVARYTLAGPDGFPPRGSERLGVCTTTVDLDAHSICQPSKQ